MNDIPIQIRVLLGLFVFFLITYPFPEPHTGEKPSEAGVIKYQPIQDNKYSISGKDYEFVFAVDKKPRVFKGVAVMTGFNRGIKEGGFLLTLHSISNKSSRKFQKKYGKSNRCPAPFFNRHAHQKLLLAANANVERDLLSWSVPDYRKSEFWQNYKIKGRCARKLLSGKNSDVRLNMHRAYFKRCRIVVVDEVLSTPWKTKEGI
ncbi:MAG: hypothetical protein AAFW66_09210 [Pseudomonadota bacterium]